MFGIGQQELIIFLVIVLIIFGPKNLPKLASSMGSAIRDFKASLGGVDRDVKEAMDEVKKPVETQAQIVDDSPPATAGCHDTWIPVGMVSTPLSTSLEPLTFAYSILNTMRKQVTKENQW